MLTVKTWYICFNYPPHCWKSKWANIFLPMKMDWWPPISNPSFHRKHIWIWVILEMEYTQKKYHNEHGPPQNRENWWLSTFQANFSNKPILFMASHTLRADTLRACTSWSISFAPVGTSGGQSRHQPTSQVVGRSKKGTRNGWDMMISPIWKEKAAKEPLIVFLKNGTYSFWEVEARVKTGNCSRYNMLWSIWKAVSIGESLFAIPNMDSLVNQTPFTVPSSFVKQLQKMILAIFFGDLSNPNCKSKGFKGRSKYPNWLTKKLFFGVIFWD